MGCNCASLSANLLNEPNARWRLPHARSGKIAPRTADGALFLALDAASVRAELPLASLSAKLPSLLSDVPSALPTPDNLVHSLHELQPILMLCDASFPL